MEKPGNLRADVDVPDRPRDLLESHAGYRPVIVLVRVREGAIHLAPKDAIPAGEFEPDIADLLQPRIRVHPRVGASDAAAAGVVDEGEKPGAIGQQQLVNERGIVAVRIERLGAGDLGQQRQAVSERSGLRLLEFVDRREEF